MGLAIGMASGILIFLWVNNELSYDKFHEKADRIYRVVQNQFYSNGVVYPVRVTPAPLAPVLAAEYPEIETSARLATDSGAWYQYLIQYEDKNLIENISFTDPAFFDIFSFPFIYGDPAAALTDKYSLAICEEVSEKIFGGENPLGKVVKLNDTIDLTITGVFKDIPGNSHIKFQYLANFYLLDELGRNIENWGSNSFYTYVLLNENTSKEIVDPKIKERLQKEQESNPELFLQPLTTIHLYYLRGGGNIVYVRIFSLIAIGILLIACINFMNLSTAKSTDRSKEVGIRKVVGSSRKQIMFQFLGESILISCFGLILALLLVEAFIPFFNNLVGKELSVDYSNLYISGGFLLLMLTTGLLAGSYPAFILSAFHPVESIKGTIKRGTSGQLFRRILVISQFSLSILLIISTGIIYKQLKYIQDKNLGFKKDRVVSCNLQSELKSKTDAIKAEIMKSPLISSATVSTDKPTRVSSNGWGWEWEGLDPEEEILISSTYVDEDYAKTFEMEIMEGRFYSGEFGTESSSMVINQTFARLIGDDSAVGKTLTRGDQVYQIIGVVKDFNFQPLKSEIDPLVMQYEPTYCNQLFVKIGSEDVDGALKHLKSVMAKFSPGYPFEFEFLDQAYDKMYKSEKRLGKIFRNFTILAVAISCLGLFGLAAFTVEKRTKEIGIRKVLGATVMNILYLISVEFVVLVGISGLIACPFAWYFSTKWLEGFAYRAEIGFFVFVSSCLLACVIAVATVSFQAAKTAFSDPAKSLRYE